MGAPVFSSVDGQRALLEAANKMAEATERIAEAIETLAGEAIEPSRAPYVFDLMPGKMCRYCGSSPVYRLAPAKPLESGDPTFSVCWSCRTIEEIGRGAVTGGQPL